MFPVKKQLSEEKEKQDFLTSLSQKIHVDRYDLFCYFWFLDFYRKIWYNLLIYKIDPPRRWSLQRNVSLGAQILQFSPILYNSRFFLITLICFNFRNCVLFFKYHINKTINTSIQSIKLENWFRLRGTPFVERIDCLDSSSTIDSVKTTSVDERIENTFSYTISSKNSKTYSYPSATQKGECSGKS